MHIEEIKEQVLNAPRCFANTKNGDLMIVWWDVNAPVMNTETGWVEISEKIYKQWGHNS